MPLTEKQIQRATPRDKEYFLSDGRGLLLRVQPTGTKTFVARSRVGGRSQVTTLGRHPHLSLGDARVAATAVIPDPHGLTVAQAWAAYRLLLAREYKDPGQVYRRMEVDIVIPPLAGRRVAAVKRADVTPMLQAIVDRGSPVAANRTLADVKKFFNYVVEKGWREDNPMAIVTRRSVGGKEKSKNRALTLAEISRDVAIIRRSGIHPLTRRALALILVTTQRPSEILGISCTEVHHDWWVLPASRTKNGLEHKVWLHPTVRRWLGNLFDRYGDRPFMSDHRAVSQAVRDLEMTWTPHDLRRTSATRMGDLGVMPHVVEKILNHKMEGMMAVYNHTEYLAERQAAQQAWGDTVLPLLRGEP